MSYWIELAYGMDGRGNDLQGEALKRRISPVALKESKLESAVLVQDPRGRWERMGSKKRNKICGDVQLRVL